MKPLDIKEWVALIVQSMSLLAIIFSAIKIINRNEDEWRQKELRFADYERRLAQLEVDFKQLRNVEKDVVSLTAKVDEMMSEFRRIRDRLDRFLDGVPIKEQR